MNAAWLGRLKRVGWLWCIACALTLGSVAARAEIVDRIVAVIDRDVITLSEAEEAAELRALRGQEPLALSEVVERLIEMRLVEREVSRYPEEAVPQEQVYEVIAALRASFGEPTAFSAALSVRGLTEDELSILIRRQLTIERYLESRFRPLVYVSDEQVERYYHEALLPDVATAGESPPPLTAVAVGIRRILEEQIFNERVEEWIERLKSRSEIRRYVW